MATKKGTFQDYQGNELCPDLPAQELLNKIKTVDGLGSGLDADLLDGKQASEFAASNHPYSGEHWSGSGKSYPYPKQYRGSGSQSQSPCRPDHCRYLADRRPGLRRHRLFHQPPAEH